MDNAWALGRWGVYSSECYSQSVRELRDLCSSHAPFHTSASQKPQICLFGKQWFGTSSKELNIELPYDPSFTSGCILRVIAVRDPDGDLHTLVHSSIVHSNQKGEAARVSVVGRENKVWRYLCDRMLLSF